MAVPGYNGSGVYVRKFNWQQDAANDIDILADRHDQEDDGFANGLTNCLTKDGQTQPTADIPMNGKKLTNVGAPVADGDAVNKGYVDGVRNFTTSITLKGGDVNGRIVYDGAGMVGEQYTVADLFFGVVPAAVPSAALKARFVWNNKADGTGGDIMVLDDGNRLAFLEVAPADGAAGWYTSQPIFGAQHVAFNAYYDSTPAWKAKAPGWAFVIAPDLVNGTLIFYRSSVKCAAAGEIITWQSLLNFDASKNAKFPSAVFASAAYLNTDGNITGTIWANLGYNDAYSAIVNRIESRAAAHAASAQNYCVTDTRMAGETSFNRSGNTGKWQNSGYVFTGVQGTSPGGDATYFARQPQRYIAAYGWAAAFGF